MKPILVMLTNSIVYVRAPPEGIWGHEHRKPIMKGHRGWGWDELGLPVIQQFGFQLQYNKIHLKIEVAAKKIAIEFMGFIYSCPHTPICVILESPNISMKNT